MLVEVAVGESHHPKNREPMENFARLQWELLQTVKIEVSQDGRVSAGF